jgi:hypothetical protein
MRKLSKTRSSERDRIATETGLVDNRAGRIAGAIITAWPATHEIDLEAFFARSAAGPTVTGSVPPNAMQAGRAAEGTVSLSDGTRITFATALSFDTVEFV